MDELDQINEHIEQTPEETANTDRIPEARAEVIERAVDEPPPPELVEAVVHYFSERRVELERKIVNLETLLGFVTSGADDDALAARVARLESFCGVKA